MPSIDYRFNSKALTAGEDLIVVDFKGIEAISEPYEFTINLKSESTEIDLGAMLSNRCTFEMEFDGDIKKYHGVLSVFDQLHQVGKYTLYQAVLVPTIWQLSLYRTNEIYLDMGVRDIIEAVLEESKIPSLDYEINFSGAYTTWPFRCQFGETHLQLLSRLMEHQGIYYYFEQGDNAEKIIFCDSLLSQKSMNNPKVNYAPITGLDKHTVFDNIQSLVCRQNRLPKNLVLKDYNYEKPSLDIEGTAVIDEEGVGEVFNYGENFDTPEEGKQLAKVRAEELGCKKERFYGGSAVYRLTPGYFFQMEKHFRQNYNQEYMLISVEHTGKHPSHLTHDSSLPDYHNSYTAIPGSTQFRSEQKTQKPRFYGTINALIDAEQDGEYAELDKEGRYKVLFPFDRISEHEGGKASHWVRMAQPYGGSQEGMFFPLRKGTEVLLTFINGDPDQPVISGVVPNATNPAMINADSQTNSRIKTNAGNMIEMEDKEGENRLKLYSPKCETYLHLGSHNAPGDGLVLLTKGVFRTEVAGGQQLTLAVKDHAKVWKNGKVKMAGAKDPSKWTDVDELKHKFIPEQSIFAFPLGVANGIDRTRKVTEADEVAGKYIVERKLGDKYFYSEGNEYYFGRGNVFEFGDSFEVTTLKDETDGYAVNQTQKANTERIAERIPGVIPSGSRRGEFFVEHTDGPSINWKSSRSHEFNFCEGNAYNFGPGWSETFIETKASATTPPPKLNQKFSDKDIAAPGGTSIVGKQVNLGSKFNVEKSLGNTYSYGEGNSIDISYDSNSESQTYGGKFHEYVYSKSGTPLSYTFNNHENGDYENRIFDAATGTPVSLNKGNTQGGGKAEFNFCFCAETNFDISFGILMSTEIKGAGEIKTSIAGGISVETNIYGGSHNEIKLAAGNWVEAELIPSKIEINSEKFGLKTVGAAIFKGIAPVAVTSAPPVTVQQLTVAVTQSTVQATNQQAAVANSAVKVQTGGPNIIL